LFEFGNWCLVKKHQKLLDTIKWDPIPPDDVVFVQAQACSKNRGTVNKDESVQPIPHHIYGDGDLMADTWELMRMTLAAAAEATFTVMDVPMTHLRQCAVTMDKWKALLISHCLIILGLVFNTRKMTVGVTPDY